MLLETNWSNQQYLQLFDSILQGQESWRVAKINKERQVGHKRKEHHHRTSQVCLSYMPIGQWSPYYVLKHSNCGYNQDKRHLQASNQVCDWAPFLPKVSVPETEGLHEEVSEETKGPKQHAICRTRDSHQRASPAFSQSKFNHGCCKDTWRQDSRSFESKHVPRLAEAYAPTRI